MNTVKTFLYCAIISTSATLFAQHADFERPVPSDSETNCKLRYYYYPNLEAYFDNQTRFYLFRDRNEWKSEKEIPSGYRGYGLFNRAYVPITDYDDDNITQFLDVHRKKYPYNSLRRTRSAATASVD